MSSNDRLITRFDASSTAADVLDGVDLTGKRVVITGASSGLGAESARVLAAAGAEVTLAVRNLDAGRSAAENITDQGGGRALKVVHLDLDDPASIDTFSRTWDGPLDILINNAGIMALPERRLTAQGWEQQFATNHLGHFALTVGLHAALAAADGARVVSLSSAAHHRSPLMVSDINFTQRPYDPWMAYAQSKTANILFAVEAAARWAGDGITVHPGGIYETGLLRHVDITPEFQQIVDATEWKTVEQGAATQVFAAGSPLAQGITGRYFADSNEAPVDDNDFERGVAAHAYDRDAATQLWDISVQAIQR